jgi:hypothetical protein
LCLLAYSCIGAGIKIHRFDVGEHALERAKEFTSREMVGGGHFNTFGVTHLT